MSPMRWRPRAVKPASLLSLAAIAGVLVLGIGYLSFGVLHLDPFHDRHTVRILLANSGGVGTGSPVLLSGVPAGKVAGVSTVASGVELRLDLHARYRIPAASELRIEALSALGEPYVEFDPPNQNGPYLADGQLIDARTTALPMSIPQVAVRAVQLMRQFDPEAISSLVGTIDTAITGTRGHMPAIEHASTLLAATILSRTDLIRQLLTDMQTLGGDMNWTGPALDTSGPQWAGFGASLDRLIVAASGLYSIGDSPADYNTGEGIVPFLQRLDALLWKIGPQLTDLAPALRPLMDTAAESGSQIDLGALISQALATVGSDGAIHLRINLK
ncbi:virulence factor Mce-like protein [Nocardia tenerifensis]|uniref:Virulence factor Mce-like protein n=1 Tax=Nocardia tenerifensis TaxID=228006 RepID=A0A318JRN5_9NOCA|nr:MlaD family protein [Nocardia tenerifensis]PXX58459.1 virulence factor Mce-like protein [Nocardia tenerifensis]